MFRSKPPSRPSLYTPATFLHKPGKVFTDFSEVRREIDAETARTLGAGKVVSSEPIMLTVHSSSVPNLTLVDMPGLTKVATQDQPRNIVQDIERMAGRCKHTVVDRNTDPTSSKAPGLHKI